MKRKNKAPYIQNSGEWPACGLKINGTFYEIMKQEKIFIQRKQGKQAVGKCAKVTSMKQIRGEYSMEGDRRK
jgi:hypothetical protein